MGPKRQQPTNKPKPKGKAAPAPNEDIQEVPDEPLPPVEPLQCLLRALVLWVESARIVHICVAAWVVAYAAYPKVVFSGGIGGPANYQVDDTLQWCHLATGNGGCAHVPEQEPGRSGCVQEPDTYVWKQPRNVSCGSSWCCFGKNRDGHLEGATSELSAQCSDFTYFPSLVSSSVRMQVAEPVTGQAVLWLKCDPSELTEAFATVLRVAFFAELVRILWIPLLARRLPGSYQELDPETDPTTAAAPAHLCSTAWFLAAGLLFPPLLGDYLARGSLGGPCTAAALRLCGREHPGLVGRRGLPAWRPPSSCAWTVHRVFAVLGVEATWAFAAAVLVVYALRTAGAADIAVQGVFAVTAAGRLMATAHGAVAPCCRRREKRGPAEEPLLSPEPAPDLDGPEFCAALGAAAAVLSVAACPARRPLDVYAGPATDALPVARASPPSTARQFGGKGRKGGTVVVDLAGASPRGSPGEDEVFAPL
eukprot:TRINITY_DN56696_c0_g1_i1.p2 TRINITY_DN56696_c0_g1~~TRINITY_DN56696_c0_g1_i1.p2  ORF type:complete len:478 (+),score=87.40 TRINITY_DN56696_c0_g1_i1:62-1495(+)